MNIKTFVFWVLSFIFVACSAMATTISDVRLSAFSNGTGRIVVESDAKLNSKIFTLQNPNRLVLDMPKSVIKSHVRRKEFKKNTVVSKVRFGKQGSDTARVVFDLSRTVEESHFMLPPEAKKGIWRLVIDLKPNSKPVEKKAIPQSVKPTTPKATTVKKQESTSGLLPFSKSKKVVMLDAGHGGQDPGAISKAGRYEKDLTLKMAKETKKLLENAGYKVVLSRDRDIFISLRGRVKKAHEAKADLFISIHADSAKNTSARGLSIYTISEKASDKEAAALAERENKSDILLGMDLDDYQQEVSSVLIDLAKQDTMKESRRYADLVVKEMQRTVQLLPNAHRFAGFAVLKSPNIPSVLLEMGYMSNKKEEREMQKSSYRKKLGQALVRAVNAYFKEVGN
ncbi:MAG: N-acetylmuramoyl-L-alanine amidase [Alphaproteobacteria bacterium]|nr:N-acetylmuramoyl-L-alanine amidase [Alphaproteobacteria bacterium]